MTIVPIIMLLFFLFMFLKPFYLQSSGSIGVADICLMGCFALLLGQRLWELVHGGRQRRWCSWRTFWKERGRKIWFHRDFLLYCFLAVALGLNLFYALRLRNHEFLKYSTFWLYNGFAIWIWQTMADWCGFPFFRMVNTAAKINLVVQYIIRISGRGRIFYEYWGAVRYMGTFNDPNQMAFFLLMMLLLIWMYRCKYGDRSFWIFFLLTLPVLADSKSTGVWLGMTVWGVFWLAYEVYCLWKKGYITRRMLVAVGACLLLSVSIVLYLLWPSADFDVRTVDYNLINRIREKIWKVTNGGFYSLSLDRGAGRLFLHPQYLLCGAGEGGFERFSDAGAVDELHSTWLSIWFCYGTVPMVLMILWLWKVLKANTPWMWCGILALLAESFFLINYRQPMFWMLLLYADAAVMEGQERGRCEIGICVHKAAGKRCEADEQKQRSAAK